MNKLKVLIVEDDKSLRDLYDLAIPDDIFEKCLVDNGEKAIDVYKFWGPDIILLDILLPKISGETVLKEIRKSFNDKSTTIIVSSVIDSEIHFRICSIFGIQGYIVKPFNYKHIAKKALEGYSQINPEVAKSTLVQLEKSQEQITIKGLN